MSDNPFEPSGAATADLTDYGPDTLEPVALDFGALFTRAWEVMRDNLGTIIAAVAIQVGVQIAFSVINQGMGLAQQGLAEEGADGAVIAIALVNLLIQIAGGVVSIWLGLGVIRVMINLAKGRMASVNMVFGQGNKLLPAIVIGIIVGLGTFVGLLLLIVPGIIVAIALQYANYELVDRDADIGSAIQGSWNLAWPHMWLLFGIGLAIFFGVLILAVLTCGIALLLAAVYVPVLQAVIYQALRHDFDVRAEAGLA